MVITIQHTHPKQQLTKNDSGKSIVFVIGIRIHYNFIVTTTMVTETRREMRGF